ncbi:MAG TPA: BlaI/MecI/CopY family transcriptional regulator [Pirellulales bacterium]|nr:BlaI/MecI/CopY family transcriptional regulator [Pirellulales bacterium]
MARRPQETPTEAELEILKVLWERGPSTGREVADILFAQRKRAYTSVMSVLNIMANKGQVIRKPQGRTFVYSAKRPREKTLGKMVGSLLGSAFEGSAASLVSQLLDQSKPTSEELDNIRKVIEEYQVRSDVP